MAITEESRRRLHRELTGVMGEEGATLVVEHLPPIDWTEVATKRDLADTKAELRAEIHDVRREVGMVRVEMTGGFALIDERFKAVDARLAHHEKLFATKEDLLGVSVQLHQELRRMTMTLLFAGFGFVSAAAAAAGLVVGT